jgi:hypothetical protein
MLRRQMFDRHGRRIDDDRLSVVPDGATLQVPMRFADGRRPRLSFADARGADYDPAEVVRNADGCPAGFKPGSLSPGRCFSPTDTAYSRTRDLYPPPVGETARQQMIVRLGEAWKSTNLMPPMRDVPRLQRRFEQSGRRPRIDAASDNAEGMSLTTLPSDIQKLSMTEQRLYVEAFNQHMEENPDADEAECDSVARGAIGDARRDELPSNVAHGPHLPNQIDADACQRTRDAVYRRHVAKLSQAWRSP